jgi:hypothetical protein
MRLVPLIAGLALLPTTAHAAKEPDVAGMLIGVLVMIGIAVVGIWWNHETGKAAADPTDLSASTTDGLGEKTRLSGGPWVITFIRQSGNVHRVDSAATADEAVRKVQAAFRRAKIDLVRISQNGPDGFSAHRAMHNHRGSSEGKKLGGVKVTRGA